MDVVRYILKNPLGWAISVVHWIVVAFAFLGDRPIDPLGFGVHSTTELVYYLALLDFPALVATKLLFSPFDPSISITPLTSIIPIGLVTLQWLIVGAGLTKLHKNYRTTAPADGDVGIRLR